MRAGTLYVRVDGSDVPVAHCTVEIADGGVFVTEESDRGRSTMTWRRIGTLPNDARAKLKELKVVA